MTEEPVTTELDDEANWRLLAATSLGRLAITAGGEIDIFPITYVVDDKTLLFRTAPGTKLVEVEVGHPVALEIDGYSDAEAWSVVVKGSAARLEHQDQIDAADTLPLTPWIPTLKYTWVRITPTVVSGRRFRRGTEPERYTL